MQETNKRCHLCNRVEVSKTVNTWAKDEQHLSQCAFLEYLDFENIQTFSHMCYLCERKNLKNKMGL
jgi:hypothetical protein